MIMRISANLVIILVIIMQLIGCTGKKDDEANVDDQPLPLVANLEISDLQLTGSIAGPGQIQTLQFTLTNTGNAPAGEFVISVQYDNAGMEPSDLPPGPGPIAGIIMTGVTYFSTGLGANEAEDRNAFVRLALTGVTTITIHVDADDEIPESDESDNVLEFEIIVPASG